LELSSFGDFFEEEMDILKEVTSKIICQKFVQISIDKIEQNKA